MADNIPNASDVTGLVKVGWKCITSPPTLCAFKSNRQLTQKFHINIKRQSRADKQKSLTNNLAPYEGLKGAITYITYGVKR